MADIERMSAWRVWEIHKSGPMMIASSIMWQIKWIHSPEEHFSPWYENVIDSTDKRATKSKVICMIIAIVGWRVVHLNEKAWNVVLLIRHIFCVRILRWEWGGDNHFGEAIIGHAKSHRTTHSREWDLMCFYLLFGDKLNEKRCWNWTKIKCENLCGGFSGTDVFARNSSS